MDRNIAEMAELLCRLGMALAEIAHPDHSQRIRDEFCDPISPDV